MRGPKVQIQNLLFVICCCHRFFLPSVAFCNLLPSVAEISVVSPFPSTPLPCSPIPWGKVPSKNLSGHQKLIGPTPRPASHWWVDLSTLPQNYFEAESSFSSCISGQGAAAIFVLEIIFEIIFVLEITQHWFSSANWRATQLEACSPTNPGRLKHQIHILHVEEIFPICTFALFSEVHQD